MRVGVHLWKPVLSSEHVREALRLNLQESKVPLEELFGADVRDSETRWEPARKSRKQAHEHPLQRMSGHAARARALHTMTWPMPPGQLGKNLRYLF